MKFPRGVSADRLIRAFEGLGYRLIHQKGSHAKLRHDGPPQHTISVPMHHSIKIGTLHSIVSEVAKMRGVELESIIKLL